jgi:hypothetical protein
VRAALALLCLLLATAPRAAAQQRPDPGGKPEPLPAVDPYTRGAPAALERAGYVSFGPFLWLARVDTREVEQALGEPRILWAETEHFRIGSTLASYRLGADRLEDKRLRAELERLARKFAKFEPERNRLDPWLRLHLYAQRLEEQYAEFRKRFGFGDLEFALPRGPDSLGPGPYLGMELKHTVLLCENSATLGRYTARFGPAPESCNSRGVPTGATMFLGQSAECLRDSGFELDAALHCAIAADLAHNLLDGFRGYHDSTPEWFKAGLSSWFSRRVDERFTLYARGTTYHFDDDSWKWEPRVRGLVEHGLAPTWARMLEWQRWEDIDAQGHMLAWARCDWLLGHKPEQLRALLFGLTEPALTRAGEAQCLVSALGLSLPELDAQWKASVLKTSPRK